MHSCAHAPVAFAASRKLIGARYFLKGFESSGSTFEGFRSARDDSGHGSHTASTAAGRLVMATDSGLATGMARGGAPMAHVAVYKACWGVYVECDDSDLLAAIDAAVDDGVDILSLSVQNVWNSIFYHCACTFVFANPRCSTSVVQDSSICSSPTFAYDRPTPSPNMTRTQWR